MYHNVPYGSYVLPRLVLPLLTLLQAPSSLWTAKSPLYNMIQLQIYPCCSHLPGSPIFNYHAKFSKLKPPVHPSHERHLTALQRRKLYLHECCAHEGFDNLNRRIREGRFPNVDPALASVPDPQCLTCNFSKAHRHSHKSNNGHISSDHKHPGDGVSSDGMEAATPGRPFTTRGQPSNTRFRYTSFWIDHMSSFVYVTFHASKAASELLKSKTEFESWAQQYNVNIKSIRADNRVYAAQSFQEACHKKQQKLSFCGVGAHWQNGIAERFIRSITERARTILLHAMHRWPEVIKEELWTFAVQHAVAFFTCFNKKGQTLLSPSFIHRWGSSGHPTRFSGFWISLLCFKKGVARWF